MRIPRQTTFLFLTFVIACKAWQSSRLPVRLDSRRPVVALDAAEDEKVEMQNTDSIERSLTSDIPPFAFENEHKGSGQAFSRAQRLVGILNRELVRPIGLALIRGLHDDWNSFWEQEAILTSPSTPGKTLAECAVSALEQMGPTYVKFGQALASRPDVVPRSLALKLSSLQDQMEAFDTLTAKSIIEEELGDAFESENTSRTLTQLQGLLTTLSPEPVAAASIGQVYSAWLTIPADDKQHKDIPQMKVAIKVQRPGIRELVEQDADLLLQLAQWVESLPGLPRGKGSRPRRLVETDLTGAVKEFMTRIFEELDYRNEAQNLQTFADLYSDRRFTKKGIAKKSSSNIQVVVPEVFPDLCTDNVLVMEWIDGTKLVDMKLESVEDYDPKTLEENLALVTEGVECTLSQLLDTGILHADPHGGNLFKVMKRDRTTGELTPRLGYVDFGLLATIPVEIRDGLICAVAQLVFARNVTAVANLFGELALIPEEVLNDPNEMEALAGELNNALSQVLVYEPSKTPSNSTSSNTAIPVLRFDKLLDVLSRLIPRFRFQLPPYFLNNARALSTVEGIARELQPDFNVLTFVYPYALKRVIANPSNSPVVAGTVESLICHPGTDAVDMQRVRSLIHDLSLLSGNSKSRIVMDIWKASPEITRRVALAKLKEMLPTRSSSQPDSEPQRRTKSKGGRWTKMADYLRL